MLRQIRTAKFPYKYSIYNLFISLRLIHYYNYLHWAYLQGPSFLSFSNRDRRMGTLSQ
uniref:Uncharacterized protein n=1 Tax=Anguilla anguilla TaxID=7936 RepID=A0A0E9QGW0_ANGAN